MRALMEGRDDLFGKRRRYAGIKDERTNATRPKPLGFLFCPHCTANGPPVLQSQMRQRLSGKPKAKAE